MKQSKLVFIIGVLAVLCMLPSLTYGDPVTVQFTGPTGPSLGGEYTAFYGGTIDGAMASLICDDINNNISYNESWVASRIRFSQITDNLATKPLFLNTAGVLGYAKVGWLAEGMFNGTLNTQYANWAIWDTFAPGAAQSHLTGEDLQAVIGESGLNDLATGWAAHHTYADPYLSNLWLLTPTGDGIMNGPGGSPQEMITSTPEAPGLALLGLDLSGLLGLLAVIRRRIRRRE